MGLKGSLCALSSLKHMSSKYLVWLVLFDGGLLGSVWRSGIRPIFVQIWCWDTHWFGWGETDPKKKNHRAESLRMCIRASLWTLKLKCSSVQYSHSGWVVASSEWVPVSSGQTQLLWKQISFCILKEMSSNYFSSSYISRILSQPKFLLKCIFKAKKSAFLRKPTGWSAILRFRV